MLIIQAPPIVNGGQIYIFSSPKTGIWDRLGKNLEGHFCLSGDYRGSMDSLLRANT